MYRHCLAILFSAATALPAAAAPITNDPGQCFAARWVTSRATDCNQVCRRVSLSAEQMPISGAAGAQPIYVCRYRVNPQWAFGTQSSGNCRAEDGGQLVKRTRFECLCARRVRC